MKAIYAMTTGRLSSDPGRFPVVKEVEDAPTRGYAEGGYPAVAAASETGAAMPNDAGL